MSIKINYGFVCPTKIQLASPPSPATASRNATSSASKTVSVSESSISSALKAANSATSSAAFKPKPLSCFEAINYYLTRLIAKVHFFFHSLSYATINPSASLKELNKTYFALGADKWKECIDGKYHHLGKDVFAKGTHGGCVEPEYVPSMERAFEFCAGYLNKKVDADWYLQLHQHTCGHFNGDPKVYLMGQEKVGVFRDSDDTIMWWPSGFYVITVEAKKELEELDAEIKREFGPGFGLGAMTFDTTHGCWKHSYATLSRTQVRQIFDKFLREFYIEVESAPTPDAKLTAIARLNKRLELLHPPRDGSGRTNTAFINKVLVDYGFTPSILDQPFVSSTYGLTRWTQYVKDGMAKWQRLRDQVAAGA
ncbi:MAG: hypothetical protein JSS60_08690 [Verrucomicrobia bacterium]|nr:hypothetical protein [Verrucomicrobiota bacterium]